MVVSTYAPDVEHVERFTEAQDAATEEQLGLWAACGGADTPLGPTAALITDCGAFGSFEEAQDYYAANPAAQPDLDPNADGRACEVYFGVDQAAEAPANPGTGDAPAAQEPAVVEGPPAGGGCDPSYPGVCIPPAPPDLDCGEVGFRRFQVLPPDPHGFDGDNDGVGCES